MTKKEMENRLRDLIAVLMTGSRPEFKQAKKDIASLWHNEMTAFKKSAHVVLEFLPQFDGIKKDENKQAFASGLYYFFLTLGDDHFEVLKNFTLEVIQHPKGHVREAIRHTADWLYCSLSGRAKPFVYGKKSATPKQNAEIIVAREQYLKYVEEIKGLIDQYENFYNGEKYIEQMKPSVYKSLQQLLSRLIESPVYRNVVQPRQVTLEIFMKRKELKRAIAEMLIKTKSKYELEDILDAIYIEDSHGGIPRILNMFDRGWASAELDDILKLITDAWNYFPHQSLNGLSPYEMVKQYGKSNE